MNLLQQGGFMMWPLLILSIVSLAIMAERFIVFTTRRFPSRNVLKEIFRLAEESQSSAIEKVTEEAPTYLSLFTTLLSGKPTLTVEQEVQFTGEEILFALRRKLDLLATIITAAPLIGLLGTVLGMIQSFSRLSSSGNVDIAMLAGGIWQALLTTAAGLSVAIPSLLAHRWFCRQYEKVVYAMQHTTAMYLTQRR